MSLATGCASERTLLPKKDCDARARKIVAQMTLDEKINQLHGIQNKNNFRIVPGLPRLGIPALPVANGPAGVGPGGPGHEGSATALQAPISLAATWDIEAARSHGQLAGCEAALMGNLLLESPDINIARTPHNGRTFESFGEDPYLAAQLAVANIQGVQNAGVIANVKHFAANNQESNRSKVNDVIDERTLREIYLPAFEASVKQGHVGSVMAAYNQVNGAFCCENCLLLRQVLKDEWGFDGFVFSDFGAVHSALPSIKAGLDLEMPTGIYFGAPLKQAVVAGEVPVALLDEALTRRYSTMMRFGLWDHQPDRGDIPAAHASTALKLAAEGIVLLKNLGGQLPLQSNAIHSIALIGPFAGEAMTGGGGSSHVTPILTVSPVEGIQNIVGTNVTIREDAGTNVALAVELAKSSDVAILMLGDRRSEGRDYTIMLTNNQNALAEAVLAAQPHTVVVLKTGGPVVMPWVDQASALLEAWYPGEEDGAAVASVLFGIVNPSGKLPITFPKQEEDLPLKTPEQYPGVKYSAHYSEGLLVGYRWYDAKGIEPLFPFGHGLSYATFVYKDLKISQPTKTNSVTVEFTQTNTGNCSGAEVAQLYLGLPSPPNAWQPPRQLKGFRRLELGPGQSAQIKFFLDARSLSYWDVASHAWKVATGDYSVFVASSSRDIRLTGTFKIR
jgi:beta-glucosidase